MKKYMCLICGFIYDEKAGYPEDGIAPGNQMGRYTLKLELPQIVEHGKKILKW